MVQAPPYVFTIKITVYTEYADFYKMPRYRTLERINGIIDHFSQVPNNV